jgi:hypothetical protein
MLKDGVFLFFYVDDIILGYLKNKEYLANVIV